MPTLVLLVVASPDCSTGFSPEGPVSCACPGTALIPAVLAPHHAFGNRKGSVGLGSGGVGAGSEKQSTSKQRAGRVGRWGVCGLERHEFTDGSAFPYCALRAKPERRDWYLPCSPKYLIFAKEKNSHFPGVHPSTRTSALGHITNTRPPQKTSGRGSPLLGDTPNNSQPQSRHKQAS